MKIFIGDIKPFNKFYLDNIKSRYIKQYIKEFTSIDYFFKWAKGVTKPLFKCNFLAIINDSTTYIRNVPDTLKKIKAIDDANKYIDIVWLSSKSTKFSGIILTDEVINLKATYRTDFRDTVLGDLPNLTDKGWKELIKRIGYSWDNYIVYRDLLIEAQVVSPPDIKRIIKHTILTSAPETLTMLLERKRYCLNRYIQLKNKYSERWVKEFFTEQTDKILDAKINYANKDLPLSKIKGSQELAKYTDVILKVPITDVFMFRCLISDPVGIEMYVNCNLQQLVDVKRKAFEEKKIVSRPFKFTQKGGYYTHG